MPNIYDYTDYRAFLADYYQEQKSRHSWFSYRVFSSRIGFRSRDFIYRVIKGKKSLSASSVAKICTALELNSSQIRYFDSLVRFNQAKTPQEKDFYLNRLHSSQSSSKKGKIHKLTESKLGLFAELRNVVIRALVDMVDFREDFSWLGKQLRPSVTASQVRQSLKKLEELKLLKKLSSGRYAIEEKVINTADEVNNMFLLKFHLSCLKLASESLEKLPPDERNAAGVTMGISKENYPKFAQALQKFRKELEEMAEREQNADIVYQFQGVLFPLSEQIKPPEKKK